MAGGSGNRPFITPDGHGGPLACSAASAASTIGLRRVPEPKSFEALVPTAPTSPQTAMNDRAETPDTVPELRVARVVAAREHPDADRLLLLDVDLGTETRQIVAGIVGHYATSELPGLNIVVVANLRPARIRGEISQGMLLAAENDDGELGLLTAPDAEPGLRVAPAESPAPTAEITFSEFQEHELRAGPDGVTLDGHPLVGSRLVMDREVYGRLR